MEKVSGIVPPTTRQTWVTGERAKPKRVSDPQPAERESSSRPISESPITESAARVESNLRSSIKGGTLHKTA